jgi:transcriptional regulator NrdR family protein
MENYCKICKKNYSSIRTFRNHNKIFHPTEIITIERNDNKLRRFSCEKCNKNFTSKQNMQLHIMNSCKKNQDNTPIEKKLEELQHEISILKKESRAKQQINNGTINNNNNNITITINKVGNENILDLNEKEIKVIFDNKLESIFKFVELLNFNSRLPSNHNFCSTSLEGSYVSYYNTDNSSQQKDRKKYFFENLLYKSIFRMEQLYQKYKKTTPLLFNKEKQKQIEEDISTLKAIRDRDMNDILLKEMLKKLNLLSYNYRQTILNTWNNCDTIGCKAKTFEEDLEENDSDDIKEIDDLFIKAEYNNNEESDSEKPVLELKNKKKELNV